ncbi:hypothetical protein KEM48_004064 [Puccinia striiformis f. sp. tritici PST-130]|nr:hypothetical protein KEM48_004064 [Puccinia striiformis f. sp. tritici PST-130]
MMNEDRNTMHSQIKTNVDKYNEIPDPLKTADEVGISGNKIQDMVGLTVMSTNGIEYFPSRETQDHTYNMRITILEIRTIFDCIILLEVNSCCYFRLGNVDLKGQDQQTALARLWLYRSCGDILANAMKLLTLDPLDRM